MLSRFQFWARSYFPAALASLFRDKPGASPNSSHEKIHGLAISIEEVNSTSVRQRHNERSRLRSLSFGWLSATTLLLITLLFIILGIGLLLVWHYNTERNGFTLVTSNHYTWTYGPTAILVVVVALWRQVDSQCKAIAPWAVLHRQPTKASQSILIDYISPIQTSSLWKSLKNKHFTVAAGIVGFVLLKVVTLISTGLFILVPEVLQHSGSYSRPTEQLQRVLCQSIIISYAE